MNFKKYFEELKRRKVFKAAVAYLAVAWVLTEVASAVLPVFDTPPIVLKALIILLVLGFPVNLVFAWVYDVTPDGLKKTDEIQDTKKPSHIKGRRLNRLIIGFLSLAVILLLFNQFRRSPSKEKSTSTVEAGSDKMVKSIAVLSFKDNSPEGDQEWIASGLVDAINDNLSKIEGLQVIAHPSVTYLESNHSSPANIAEKLDLTHLLEGSVLRIEDNIRINVKLFSAEDYTQLWYKNFDQDMDSIYHIIDEVATAVGNELDFKFNSSELRVPEAAKTSNTQARELFLKAKYENEKVWGQQPHLIREYLEEAIKLDPTFYAAYSYLGRYWLSQHSWNGDQSSNFKENVQRANELLEFSIEHAPSYGDSYVFLSWSKIFYEQKLEAYSLALKGYDLTPSTSNKLALINTVMPALGNDPENNYNIALEAMKESPYEPGSWAGKGLTEYFAGKYVDAENTLDEGLSKFTESNLYATAERVFFALGKYEKVINTLDEHFTKFPGSRPPRSLGYLAAAQYKLGHIQEYDSLMDELRDQAAISPIGSPSFHLAMVNAQTGDYDAAFRWLDKAIADKEVELYWLKVEPPFKPLYDDPRWQELLDAMGFPESPEVP